jgi:hypothetical protein
MKTPVHVPAFWVVIRTPVFWLLLAATGVTLWMSVPAFSGYRASDEIQQEILQGYRRELGREPEPQGAELYEDLLRSGELDRPSFIQALRDSEEGAGYQKKKRLGYLTVLTTLAVWGFISQHHAPSKERCNVCCKFLALPPLAPPLRLSSCLNSLGQV